MRDGKDQCERNAESTRCHRGQWLEPDQQSNCDDDFGDGNERTDRTSPQKRDPVVSERGPPHYWVEPLGQRGEAKGSRHDKFGNVSE